LLILISIVTFTIIQLPPGDYLTTYIARLESEGGRIPDEEIDRLRRQYQLDKPLPVQYFAWIGNILLRGDFGRSFEYNEPVAELIGERIIFSMSITLATSILLWVISLPVGIYAATHQYSIFDYSTAFLGFIGLATPDFLFALIVGWMAFYYFNTNIIGLFSPEYVDAPWDLAKLWDFLKHIIPPVIIIGTNGTAGFIRVVRGTLLDELGKQYVITARAKGLSENKVLIKYPVRVVLNPMMSTIGWILPGLVSGEVIVSLVLNLPTAGPLMLNALLSQDMYLAGSILMILSSLTLLGTLISDIALAWLDPRIRYERVGKA
jgi:peptide/nickel transport system permease protein